MHKVIGRLAPSPTGALHLGNARTFLIAWLSVRAAGGRIILRIEDIDSPRVKPWARQATLDDLAWLGLDWDEGPDKGGPHAPYVQTERLSSYHVVDLAKDPSYHSALEELKQRELVYPCDCSRSEIAAAASAPHEAIEGPIYAGRCRHRCVADAAGLSTADFAWRFRATETLRSWVDVLAGHQQTVVAHSLGDFLVAKGDGTPAYQLAVVVDDHWMKVNEVVRGRDLIASTFRQLELLSVLAWDAPRYMHVPLMIGSDGRRLAKRHGDTRIAWFRQAGYSAAELWGYLAWSIGLTSDRQPVMPQELIEHWDPLRLNNEPTVFEMSTLSLRR